MKICIDVSPAVHHRAGIGRYAQELVCALVKRDTVNEYIGFFNRAPKVKLGSPVTNLRFLPISRGDRTWRLAVLLSQLTGVSQNGLFPEVDMFHATDNLLPSCRAVPSVYTLYDLAFHFFPETHTPMNRFYLRFMMPRFLRRADAIIAISEHTKQDAIRIYGIPESKITIIHLAANESFRPGQNPGAVQLIRNQYGLPEHYFLFVGTIEPRKNLVTVLEAFKYAALDKYKLVLVGKKGWLYDEFFSKVRSLGLEERVVLAGYVPEASLPVFYAGATAFVYPSLYEGFGLPVLEAMACGVPVVASNTSSIPEVAGNAALLLSPAKVKEWKEGLELVVKDKDLCARLVRGGLKRAQQFSWEKTAKETLSVYRRVYASRC